MDTFDDNKLIEYIKIGMVMDYNNSRTIFGELLGLLKVYNYTIKTEPYPSYSKSLLIKIIDNFFDIDSIHYLLTQKHIYIGYKPLKNNEYIPVLKQHLYSPLLDIFYIYHFIYNSEEEFIKWFEIMFYLLDNNVYYDETIKKKIKDEFYSKLLDKINSFSDEKINNYYNELSKRIDEYQYTNI